MLIYRHYENLPKKAKGGAVAVGNFDGVHLGHLAVIEEAGRIARDLAIPWVVLTFEPHPREVFGAEPEPFRLTPFKSKARLIEAIGAGVLVALHFDLEFAKREAASFVHDVLMGGLSARHVVSGYDFVFGQGRQGNCELLLKMGADEEFDFTCVRPAHDASGAAYSSTRIRELLREGDMRSAKALLGRPFALECLVEKGDGRGQTIGFPTANMRLGEYIRPALGAYAVRVGLMRGKNKDEALAWMGGAANLGRRPTFGGEEVILEAHIFGFSGELYGQRLQVELIERLRGEKKFESVSDLRAQIKRDCEQASRLLSGMNHDHRL